MYHLSSPRTDTNLYERKLNKCKCIIRQQNLCRQRNQIRQQQDSDSEDQCYKLNAYTGFLLAFGKNTLGAHRNLCEQLTEGSISTSRNETDDQVRSVPHTEGDRDY